MDLSSIAGLSTPSLSDSAPASGKPSKLHQAAQQFEALLIGEMMKSVREDGEDGWLGSGGGAGDDSAMDMAQSQFANAMATSGGLGLTKVIEERMSQGSGGHPTSNPAPANSQTP